MVDEFVPHMALELCLGIAEFIPLASLRLIL